MNKQAPTAKSCGDNHKFGSEAVRPFLRWAGSKRKLLTKLLPFWSESYERYIEPFAGSACLFFAVKPRQALLGDINPELIQTLRQVRDHPLRLGKALHRLPVGKSHYYCIRAQDPVMLHPQDRAARFIYLNRFCFNGIYRTNRKGRFNVPYSGNKTGDLSSQQQLLRCSKALRKAVFFAGDFESCLDRVKGGDFVYIDPPYATGSRRVFLEYGPRVFDQSDLNRLTSCLTRIDRAGAAFVVSYAYSPEGLYCLKPWRKRKVRITRNIAGFTGHRRFSYELIATNIDAQVPAKV